MEIYNIHIFLRISGRGWKGLFGLKEGERL